MSFLSRALEILDRRRHGETVPEQPETDSPFHRRLPGVASRSRVTNNVDFRPGRVTMASERIIWIVQDHPEQKLIFACGANYFYYCEHCKCTVYEEEISKLNPIILAGARVVRCCPFCATWGPDGRVSTGNELRAIAAGDRVRSHYRSMPDASSGNWWSEIWEP